MEWTGTDSFITASILLVVIPYHLFKHGFRLTSSISNCFVYCVVANQTYAL